MKLLFFILNKTEKLDEVLTELARINISGATILESMGMARLLSHEHDRDEIPFLGSLRAFLNPEREKSKVIFAVIKEEKLEEAVSAIESVVGDFSLDDTGIIFSVPIDFTKGIRKIGK
ncbi:P-II family nitrogen regulator [Clostridium sp.]|uniref:P-II family nitrogen regulator n=1 Tax=Clostridium sp. TaxID=1506 RepID=UPI003D6D401A